MDTGTVFDGGDRIQCADPVLSAQEDPALVGCDHRESFTGSEEPPGIVPVGMYGAGGYHRNREYHGGGGGCDRRRTRCCVLDVGVGISRDGDGLRGGGPRHPLSGKRPGRRLDGGTDDLSGKAAGMSRGGGMGSMVQANAISETASYVYGIPEAVVGVILVILAGIVLAGGGRRIFLAAERLVPLSAGLYTAAALAVIILYAGNVPGVILGILADAFSFRSAVGGVAGYGISRCVSYGIARGVFSNEAGLGSLAVLNGSAEMASEELQGQWAIFEVFFDTIVSCTLTALVILCVAGSGTASEFGAENGASLTSLCFFTALGSPGGYAVAVCVVLFAFSTIIAWYYMGRQAAEYLGGKISGKIPAVYAVGYLLAAFLGCLGAMETVWEVSDIFNGLMAVPNLAALVLLAGEIYAPGEKRDP